MKEDFLHYIWKFKKMDVVNLKTTEGSIVKITNVGSFLEGAGPDFFNAQIIIGSQKWAGNVEIHCKSSDWYVHHHERDAAYENVILHVVWEHDAAVFRNDNSEIPVVCLKDYVKENLYHSYVELLSKKSWINCEKQLKNSDSFLFKNWQERLFFERLDRKSSFIHSLLQENQMDWEAVLFCMLAKNFGLNTNGDSFLKLAQAIPFSVIRKESFVLENLEALLFGQASLLDGDKEDTYFNDLKIRFFYLLQKYQIDKNCGPSMQFFKHRPDNFPSIRLAQLAQVYHQHQNLFYKIISCTSLSSIYELFKLSPSKYWQSHYQFDKTSPDKIKKLSTSFIDLLMINTIIPFKFAYAKSQAKDISEELMQLLYEIVPEKNAIIDKFSSFGIVSKNAFDTQTLLQLKNEYCSKNYCLSCQIGVSLLIE